MSPMIAPYDNLLHPLMKFFLRISSSWRDVCFRPLARLPVVSPVALAKPRYYFTLGANTVRCADRTLALRSVGKTTCAQERFKRA